MQPMHPALSRRRSHVHMAPAARRPVTVHALPGPAEKSEMFTMVALSNAIGGALVELFKSWREGRNAELQKRLGGALERAVEAEEQLRAMRERAEKAEAALALDKGAQSPDAE